MLNMLAFSAIRRNDDCLGINTSRIRSNEQSKMTNFVDGVWIDERHHFVMYVNGDYSFTKYRDDGVREDYDSQGRLTSITDLNGNVITFSYGQYGISQITDTVGRTVTFNYSSDKLTSITDGVRTISYSYSGGKLTAVTDPIGRMTTYEYMSQNSFLITGVHYPSGGFSSYEYGTVVPEAGKIAPCKSSETEDGETQYYFYKVDSPDTVTWTSPKDLAGVTGAVSSIGMIFLNHRQIPIRWLYIALRR